ncbi:hypothetical protein BGW80DRAFT_432779 [Lactifluus volemus]|nr:hypothetical protein BGW80DRAFT_432779 [Lactifluus volemus]
MYSTLTSHSASFAKHRAPRTLTTSTTNRLSTFSPTPLPFPFPTISHALIEESQETEQLVDTPLITPSGSLTWPTISSDVPVFELDNNALSYPQLKIRPIRSSVFLPHLPRHSATRYRRCPFRGGCLDSPRPTEPASSLPQPPLLPVHLPNARASSPPSPSPYNRALRPVLATGLGPSDLPLPILSDAPASAPAPRYFLSTARRGKTPRRHNLLLHSVDANYPQVGFQQL